MHYVYLAQSLSNPTQYYVGRTDDPGRRLKAHNAGEARHTSKFTPWKYVVTVGFETEKRAIEFERYLKSGSGQEFARRHFK